MAGSSLVAIESRKQAARRPRPPLPRPASGSCSSRPSQSRCFSATTCSSQGIEQQVGHVVGQRPADEELHREVVDALGVRAIVGVLRPHPPLREDVAHGAREGLEALARAGRRRIDDVVEEEMAVVEPVVGRHEREWPAAVLLEECGHPVGDRRRTAGRCFLALIAVPSLRLRTRDASSSPLSSAAWPANPRFNTAGTRESTTMLPVILPLSWAWWASTIRSSGNRAPIWWIRRPASTSRTTSRAASSFAGQASCRSVRAGSRRSCPSARRRAAWAPDRPWRRRSRWCRWS